MEKFIAHFIEKLLMILSTIWGWITGIALFVLNAIVDHRMAITFVVVVVALDLFWGLAAALKMHRFATSELMRDTLGKLAVYGTAILTFCFIDKMLGDSVTLTTAVICSIITLVELWSSMGNALIVFPSLPFLRLIRGALVGEIANKLHVSEDFVKATFEIMDEKKKDENNK